MTTKDALLPHYIRLDEIWRTCQFKSGEHESEAIPIDLRVTQLRFHSGRLEAHRREIYRMFDFLPDCFKTPPSDLPSGEVECHETWRGLQYREGLGRGATPLLQLALAMAHAMILTPYNTWPELHQDYPLIVVFSEKYPRLWWDRLLRDHEGKLSLGLQRMKATEWA